MAVGFTQLSSHLQSRDTEMGKGPGMPCHGSLGFVLSFGMPLNAINQGPFHPAKAVSHFCGFWLPAQWQALATPPLPRGFKVTFRAFQLQGIFFTWLPTLVFSSGDPVSL